MLTIAELKTNFPCTFPSHSHTLTASPLIDILHFKTTTRRFWNYTNPPKVTVEITCNTTELWVLLVKIRVFPALQDCKWEESPISLLARHSFMCWSSSSTRDLKDLLNEKVRKMKMCIIHNNDCWQSSIYGIHWGSFYYILISCQSTA